MLNSAFISSIPLTSHSVFTGHGAVSPSTSLRPALFVRNKRSNLSRQAPRCQAIEPEAMDPESGSIIVPGTFNLASFFMLSGGFMFYIGDIWIVPGFPFLLIGLLLSVQSLRIRIVFGPTRFSVATMGMKGLNLIRGWKYDEITNWEMWWQALPILFYFKEKESYNGRGSIHFFPVMCKHKVLISEMKKRVKHLDKPQYK